MIFYVSDIMSFEASGRDRMYSVKFRKCIG